MEELIPVALSRTRNYLTIGENIDPEDWAVDEVPHFNADTIFNRIWKTGIGEISFCCTMRVEIENTR